MTSTTFITGTVVTAEWLNTVKTTGRETLWLPAHSWIPNTTNGAELVTNETTTNDVMYKSLDFNTGTDESAQFSLVMPKNWDEGTLYFRPWWTAASGSGTVTWAFAGQAVSNDDPIDGTWGTAVTVTDTLIAAGDVHDAGETAAMTIAGTPAENDVIYLKVYRDVSADTLGVDAKLLGVHVYLETNAPNDDL